VLGLDVVQKMIRWINILILIAVLVASCISAVFDDSVSGFDRLFWLAAIPLTMFSLLPIFFGAMSGIFARGRLLVRPSIDKFMFARNSPLQFIWFGGMIFCAAGVGNLIGCSREGLSADGVVILASGVGVVFGSLLIVRILSRRFARTVATQQ
jgi:hypothetical protein